MFCYLVIDAGEDMHYFFRPHVGATGTQTAETHSHSTLTTHSVRVMDCKEPIQLSIMLF